MRTGPGLGCLNTSEGKRDAAGPERGFLSTREGKPGRPPPGDWASSRVTPPDFVPNAVRLCKIGLRHHSRARRAMASGPSVHEPSAIPSDQPSRVGHPQRARRWGGQ
jgi:hypothetical protein